MSYDMYAFAINKMKKRILRAEDVFRVMSPKTKPYLILKTFLQM